MMRMVPAACICALLVGAAMAAEPASPGGVTLLDHNSLWRQFRVSRCSYVRIADGTLQPREINWYWGGIRSKPATSTTASPSPPAGWTGIEFDDALWPRVRLPQPVLTVSGANPRAFYRPYETAAVMLRGTFEVPDPAQVESCTFSVTFWGGAAAYVNGKEIARAHLPAEMPASDAPAVAEDYPLEAFTTPDGKLLRVGDAKNQDRLALRQRSLSNVKIPSSLLRKGTNVVAVEVRYAPVPEVVAKGAGQEASGCGWPPIGVLSAQLAVSPAGAAVAGGPRQKGIRVWNCAPYDTVTAYDYGDPAAALRPIVVNAARNGIFSGRLMVDSDDTIKGLTAAVSDLMQATGGAKIPAAAVRIRYAEPATPGRSWAQQSRFDGLLDAIPAEIPVPKGQAGNEGFFGHTADRRALTPRAMAPLWFTVRVPKDAAPGAYEGEVTVSADGLGPVKVPLRVNVSDWTVPDPKDFRVTNFGYHAEDAVARHYGVPRWSEKHFELMGKSLALMAEVNSRQVFANLAIDFYGTEGNAETLVRWLKQPDGTYKYDFSVFDKYLDMIQKAIGKPLPLRLNCWGETDKEGKNTCAKFVTAIDAAGKVENIEQPPFGSEESYKFWKPVIDEVLRKVQERGWLDVTAFGHNSYCWAVKPQVVDVAKRLWPDGVWYYTAHNGALGGRFVGTDKSTSMPVRYADTIWSGGQPAPRGYRALLSPRPGFWCFTYRGCFHDSSPLTDLRRIAEDKIMSGHDGLSDFGVDLFPVRDARRGYYCIGNGRGTGGPGNSTKALLAAGPDGPIASERFEMFREGVQLAEAILFIQRALESGKVSGDLAARINRYLDERGDGFGRSWFNIRYIQAEQDEKLLGLASEVARAVGAR